MKRNGVILKKFSVMDDEIARLRELGEVKLELDIESLAARIAAHPQVVLAVLFGSAREGTVSEGADVDIGVLLSPAPSPLEFYAFYQQLARQLGEIDDLDLVDLNRAGVVLAFEALRGRRLVVRDPEQAAAFASLVARQYEDDMLHAGAVRAA